MKTQGGSLKDAVYLLGGLFTLIILTTSWLLGGSWKRRIRSDTDADTDTDIFKKDFYIYITVIFHT